MKVYGFSCGMLHCRKSIFVPDVDNDLFINSPMPIFLIKHRQGAVLFDTGPHPEVFRDAGRRWGGLAKALQPIGDETSAAVPQLSSIGISNHDVRYVVNSHLHPDHAGGNQFFRHSTFLVQEKELQAAENPKYDGQGYVRADWDHPLNYQAIQGEMDIYGDGRLIIIPMPGHTPGHQILLVRLARDGNLILTGDCVPCRENFEDFKVTRTNLDNERALRSIYRLHSIVEREKALVVFGHDPIEWKKIRKGKDYYC
jgi:N-acyl homoserine lactone hydrolase